MLVASGDHLSGGVAVAGGSGGDCEVFGEADPMAELVLACEFDVGLDKDRVTRHVVDGIIRDGGDPVASAGIENDGAGRGGEALRPTGCVLISGKGMACER